MSEDFCLGPSVLLFVFYLASFVALTFALRRIDVSVAYAVWSGVGTGLNFPSIVEKIGAEGRLIGVDISSEMLSHAGKRVERAGWKNVELVQSDVVAYKYPDAVDGVLSTGVFGYIADHDRVIEAASRALVPGGRLAIMDGKRPERLPTWVFNLIVRMSRSFGVTSDYFDKRTWESVDRYFRETAFEEMYGGMLFISSGTHPRSR